MKEKILKTTRPLMQSSRLPRRSWQTKAGARREDYCDLVFRFSGQLVAICLCVLLSAGCSTIPTARYESQEEERLVIDKVFFAQQHVQEPSDPLFKLVGNLEALIKVQVYSEAPRKSPDVVAMVELDKDSREFTLRGPKQLPKPYTGVPELMRQSYDDSFTGVIPREWIKPGLKVTVELRDYSYTNKFNPPGYSGVTVFDQKVFDALPVGAGSKILLTSFDVHFLEEEKDVDFPEGWEIALGDRLPVAEFEVQRVRGIVFPELVMPNGLRVRSMKEYEERTGERFDGESTVARACIKPLKRAGGHNFGYGVYFLSVAFVPANGSANAGMMSGTSDLGRIGNFCHETGHVFSLRHWGVVKEYPHKGDMYGIKVESDRPDCPHVGPTWGYSLHRRAFISSIETKAGDKAGEVVRSWKKDPMWGGGHGDQGEDQMMRHFSDYSVNKMHNFMERRALFWDEDRKAYYRWNPKTMSFSTRMESDGWNLAENPFEDVISIIASASVISPEANFIYPPIGPYKAGLLTRFDAASPKDRELAAKFGFKDEKCDLCLRVTRGGVTRTYLLEAKMPPEDVEGIPYVPVAINLPAKGADLTKLELLHTPQVISKGLMENPKVLYTWTDEQKPRALDVKVVLASENKE